MLLEKLTPFQTPWDANSLWERICKKTDLIGLMYEWVLEGGESQTFSAVLPWNSSASQVLWLDETLGFHFKREFRKRVVRFVSKILKVLIPHGGTVLILSKAKHSYFTEKISHLYASLLYYFGFVQQSLPSSGALFETTLQWPNFRFGGFYPNDCSVSTGGRQWPCARIPVLIPHCSQSCLP